MTSLHLMQLSQRFTIPRIMPDLAKDLGRVPDLAGVTEAAGFHPELERVTRALGYQLCLPPEGDTAIMVHGSHQVESLGYIHAVDASQRPRHGARGIQWVRIRPAGTDESVTFAVGHWVRVAADEGGQRTAMTDDLAALMRKAAAGDRIGFWAGDMNNPDHEQDRTPMDHQLDAGDLTSCWDELGRYPATHGTATLDVVGSYDPDRRVHCVRARVWPRLSSDHRPMSAFYRIENRRAGH